MADKPMLNYSFSTREKGLILALVIVVLVALYFFVVVQNVADTKLSNESELAFLEDQIAVQQSIADSRAKMEQEIEGLGDTRSLPAVATYDNIKNEFNMLNSIFKKSEGYTLTFQTPQLSGSTVRRVAHVTFEAATYKEADSLIRQLETGRYRCQVDDVNMNGKIMADGEVGNVSVDLSVTFFETTDGATNLTGLQDESQK